jgi:pyridoxal phosphate enzyme (YggS family)
LADYSAFVPAQLAAVRAQLAEAAVAAGRAPEDVHLVAVSKTHPLAAVVAAAEAGQVIFGENKVQELLDKHAEQPQLTWHLIGHLQTNKVKYLPGKVALIHSVDSAKLIEEIDKRFSAAGAEAAILLQFNISEEATKFGAPPTTEARALAEQVLATQAVRLMGVMGMARETDDPTVLHRQFASLRKLNESLQDLRSPRHPLNEISMGMSGDCRIAIAEGATLVRIGSAIFGNRNYTV